MKGAVVIGGHVQGLGIARMLGIRKIPIVLMDTARYNIARYSKYCNRFIKIPYNMLESEADFCEFLKHKSIQFDLKDYLIFPTDDQTVAYLSKNRDKLLDYYRIWTPKWDIIRYCYNKRLTYALAERNGIPIPKSYFVEDPSDLERISSTISFPAIIKPAVMHKFYASTRVKALVVHNKQELITKYWYAAEIIPTSEIIIQEIIPGPAKDLYSFCSFFKDRKAIVHISGRRARQIPMDFGKASTYVTLVETNEIGTLSSQLLSSIGYYGLSEVEFKYDSRDGQFKLLEINPRTWKWHAISLLSGINMPYLLYCDAAGDDISTESCTTAAETPNGKWIDEYTDLYVSAMELLQKNMTFSEYLSSIRGKKMFGSLSLDDPLPFIAETCLAPLLLRR